MTRTGYPAPTGAPAVGAPAPSDDPLWPLAVEIARGVWARPQVVAACVLCRFEWFDGETPQACGEVVCPLGRAESEGALLHGSVRPSGASSTADALPSAGLTDGAPLLTKVASTTSRRPQPTLDGSSAAGVRQEES